MCIQKFLGLRLRGCFTTITRGQASIALGPCRIFKNVDFVYLAVSSCIEEATIGEKQTLHHAHNVGQVDGGYLSKPQTIEFPTEGGLTAFLNYYPPHNKDFHLPESEKPPLLIKARHLLLLRLPALTLFMQQRQSLASFQ